MTATLPDLAEARVRRDQAVAAVEEFADPAWKDVALRAIRHVAEHNRSFISDDVWDAMAQHYPHLEPREPRAMGAVMRQAVKDGLAVLATCDHCRTTKVITTGRGRASNAQDTPVYRSLVWRAA